MGIKEQMAAKRAALAAGQGVTDVVAKEPEVAVVSTVEEPVKEEPKVLPGKPMTFAEKMLEKKRLAALGTAPDVAAKPADVIVATAASVAQSATKPASRGTATSAVPTDPKKQVSILDHLAEAAHKQAGYEAASKSPEQVAKRKQEISAGIPDDTDPETAQAYTDIKMRIDELVELSEEPLANAMTELKKALMKNPSAVSLMLDSDIGQMVIALRKMTHVAAADAAKPKKAGPKAKQVTLSAEALEAAFDEM